MKNHKNLFKIIICFALSVIMTLPGAFKISALSKVGSKGSEVTKIQTNLKKWGYYEGSVDGIYGTATKEAVKYFQRKNGLSIDGIAGPKTLAALGISSTKTASSGTSDYNLLARVISAEARGESYTGQVAVGAVILNRVAHSSFPDTIAGVVYQPGAFSCMTDSNINQPVADSAYKAATAALNGWDPSGGAIYYYNPKTAKSAWIRSRPVILTIGNHVFCK